MTHPRYLPLSALAFILAAGLATAASAQMGPPPSGHEQGGRGPGGPGGPHDDAIHNGFGTSIFFSPSGQPFRAKAGEPYPVAAWFAQADTNHDGKVSHDEFTADAVAFFHMLDRNHDNYISSPENTAYETNVAPEITRIDPTITQPVNHRSEYDPDLGVDQDPTHGKYQQSIQGASQYGLIDEPQPIRAADANFDFRISMDEWMNATTARFNILDRNGDGALTLDELPKTPAQVALEAPKDVKGAGKDKKKHFGW